MSDRDAKAEAVAIIRASYIPAGVFRGEFERFSAAFHVLENEPEYEQVREQMEQAHIWDSKIKPIRRAIKKLGVDRARFIAIVEEIYSEMESR
jgi:hypothetical protein